MEKIGVSACLLGINCKYNGGHNLNFKVIKYISGKELILICPETMGGLGTPRIPSEINKFGRIINQNNEDLTHCFELGKELSLKKLEDNDCHQVILKDASPSCGYKTIYDGSFTKNLISGQGITTKYLLKHSIKVIDLD